MAWFRPYDISEGASDGITAEISVPRARLLPGRAFAPRDPIIDLGSSDPTAQYRFQVVRCGLGQLGIGFDPRPIEPVLDHNADAHYGG